MCLLCIERGQNRSSTRESVGSSRGVKKKRRCTGGRMNTPPPSSAAQRAALHSAQHYTAPSTASQDKADRSKRTKHIQVVEYFSQRSTAAALKRYASV